MFHISRQPYPRSDPSDPDSRSQGPAASRESSGPTCPYCSGSGVDPHTDETCAACDGSGWGVDPLELGLAWTATLAVTEPRAKRSWAVSNSSARLWFFKQPLFER